MSALWTVEAPNSRALRNGLALPDASRCGVRRAANDAVRGSDLDRIALNGHAGAVYRNGERYPGTLRKPSSEP